MSNYLVGPERHFGGQPPDTSHSHCPICAQTFPNERGLYGHCWANHHKTIVECPMPNIITCPHTHCTTTFRNPIDLYDHYYSSLDHPLWVIGGSRGKYCCVFHHCRKFFHTENMMKLHYFMNHRTAASFDGLITPSASSHGHHFSSSRYTTVPRHNNEPRPVTGSSQSNPRGLEDHHPSASPATNVPPHLDRMRIGHLLTTDREVTNTGHYQQ